MKSQAVLLAIGALAAATTASAEVNELALAKAKFWSGRMVTWTRRPAESSVRVSTRDDQVSGAVGFAIRHRVQAPGPEPGVNAPDGAELIAKALADAVVTHYGARSLERGPIETRETDSGPISNAAAGADLLIDVRSDAVFLRERLLGSHKGNFAVNYYARVRVYDVRQRTQVASLGCSKVDASGAPRDELLRDGAVLLSERLKPLWVQCVAYVKKSLFGIPDP